MANIFSAAAILKRGPSPDHELLTLPGGALSFRRGSIHEISGARSSGRTALVHALLAAATSRGEAGALVDCAGAFDPASAAANGIDLARLLWVRCGRRADQAMRAADGLLHAGGFGAVVLDLCDVAPDVLRRIPLSWWYRFRGAGEIASTIFVIAANQPLSGSCAARVLAIEHARPVWSGADHVPLLAGFEMKVSFRKPVSANPVRIKAWLAG